ncbi:nanos homolog 2 [Nephila pilipes]|uniref:Nanos homolog 2 n=1 Tax=Nephila pilipes TaxID=299642 RepID=A0A8X6NT65_NEPPI|nr:nanos homolog 2 [Nephila pilipes]
MSCECDPNLLLLLGTYSDSSGYSRETHCFFLRPPNLNSAEPISAFCQPTPFPIGTWNAANNENHTSVPQFQNEAPSHVGFFTKNNPIHDVGNYPFVQGNHRSSQVEQTEGNLARSASSNNYNKSRKSKSCKKYPVCRFCLQNEEQQEFYSMHKLKDENGKIICPVLRKYLCSICGATGDTAHTIAYCPYNKNKRQMPLTLLFKQTNKDSKGRFRNCDDHFVNEVHKLD